jgi:prepilin-type N-terminal cleavage/methylation domain-containing protein
MIRRRPTAVRDERGYTLIELLVTMSVGMIVLFAILNAADIFQRSANTASNVAGAQDTARAQVREIVTFLRQGRVATGQSTPIPTQWTPSRSDLTVAAYVAGPALADPGDTAGWIRYCTITSGTQSTLLVGVRVGDAYAAPGACSPADTTNGWAYQRVAAGTLRNASRLFDFTSASCTGGTCLPAAAAVETVGINLALASTSGASSPASVIRNAVSFRNRSSS